MSYIPVVAGIALISAGIAGLIASIQKAFKSAKVKPNPIMTEIAHRLGSDQRWQTPHSTPARTENTTPSAPAPVRQGGVEQDRGGREVARGDPRRASEAAAQEERRKAEERGIQAEKAEERDRQERMNAVHDMLAASARQEEAEWKRQAAENATAEARAARDRAEMKLREGVRPTLMPSLSEFEEMKKKREYKEGLFHFAVVGTAGTGKSSLVNALRGIRNKKGGAAPTGTSETTRETTRYPDTDTANPFVWYDVPGAGTLATPDWKYFVDQGLYIFDAIIVLYGDRFTETDVAILRNCSRWKIPTYIVRSKAGVHIQNTANDMLGADDEDEEDAPISLFDRFSGPERSARLAEVRDRARGQYIKTTRADVKHNLAQAELSQQRVYIVDKDILFFIVKGKQHPDAIDEKSLYEDLLLEAMTRRLGDA